MLFYFVPKITSQLKNKFNINLYIVVEGILDDLNITFTYENIRFNFRVAALIEYNDKILLESNGKYWNLIGGRIHLGESSREGIIREIKEELGLYYENPILIEIAETFFDWKGKLQQELLFVYKVVIDKNFDITKKAFF